MGYSTANLLAAILSLALISHGAPADPVLTATAPGISVADFQTSLLGLGYDPGPVTGRMDPQTLMAAASFATQYGLSSKHSIVIQAQQRFQQTTSSPATWNAALALNTQVWLKRWHLYSGPLSGRMNAATKKALAVFSAKIGASTKHFTGADLRTMMHLETIRLAYDNHWRYHAQPGDSLSQIALSIGVSLSRLEALNPEHNGVLWVNQVVKWYGSPPPITTSSTKATTPSEPPAASPTSASISTGALSNIRPVAALVILNPSVTQVEDLIRAQEEAGKPIPTPDISMTGQWALLHAPLVKTLSHLGDEVDVSGYSGTSLASLPQSAVTQELTWASQAFRDVLGTVPGFLIGAFTPSSKVIATATAKGFIPMSPSVVLTKSSPSLSHVLTTHPQGIVVVTGAAIPKNFTALFEKLGASHFIFINLGQIWAQQ